MTTEQKLQIKEALVRYVAAHPTCIAAAATLQGITTQHVAQVLHNNWEMVTEKTWHQLARRIGFFQNEWNPADTGTHLLLRILFSDAQHFALAYGIAIGNGLGKTFTARQYARENETATIISCSELHNRKTFITALLESLNQPVTGTVPELVQQFADTIAERNEPLLIIDDAHKLKDRVLHFLITIVNCVSDKCGIVIMGNEELSTRIITGARQNREGFAMIYNTIGRRFITLGRPGPNDVDMICRANGVTNADVIDYIKEQCGNSLHGIEHLVQQSRRKAA
ncbi:MAG: ATP-binding protein [Flavipsychrobacter sp.]|nr:ATP-binding protein [Flavipsychrobacter sp.]